MKNEDGVIIAASDYLQILPDSLSGHLNRKIYSLGTFGFGRSEDRQSLRDFFEVDYRHIALTVLFALVQNGELKKEAALKAQKELDIQPNKKNPFKD
jgi:pyruvate dehydrogenase E1 component